MQSTTPEYLNRYRKAQKRSRLFEDATYEGKPLRAQPLTQEVIVILREHEMLTTQIQALVDWSDLDAGPADGEMLHYVRRGVSYEVVSYKLLGGGFCRLVLRNH